MLKPVASSALFCISMAIFGLTYAYGEGFARSLQYAVSYSWGGLSPYGSDDASEDAAPTFDFADVFGQPVGHAVGGKLTMTRAERYALRLGYERTPFRTEEAISADSSVVWDLIKNDLNVDLMWGKPYGTTANNLYPYLFAGLSFVRYGETFSLRVDGQKVDSEKGDILRNVTGFNLGGGLKLNLFRYMEAGVEIWHQWKDFRLKQEAQPDGDAKELNARLLFGVHFGPFHK
jgi:hypothetical protein